MAHQWSTQDDAYILAHHGKRTFGEMGGHLGVSRHQVRGRWLTLQNAKQSGSILHHTISAHAQVLQIKATEDGIQDVDALLREAKVDTDRWEIDRIKIQAWQTPMKVSNRKVAKDHWVKDVAVAQLYLVCVWLRPKASVALQDIKAETIAEMARHAPRYKPVTYAKSRDQHMLELAIFDLHLGKLAWGKETGEDYDMSIALDRAREATSDLLQKASAYKFNKIFVPIGNDLLHIDNVSAQTTAGTRLDADTRWPKLLKSARQLSVELIDKLVRIAPTQVIVVPGNHDYHSMISLGDSLQCWYHNAKHVDVDNSPRARKYHMYGNVLLGYTHGNEESHNDLVGLMADEVPDMWLKSAQGWREWHIGHYHKKKQLKFTAGDTHRGTSVRVIPSLSATDAWHHRKGFVKSPRCAEAYVWHAEHGYVGHFSSTPVRNSAA
jgi:hypothetical protein